MNRHIIIHEQDVDKLKRQAAFAYIASFLAQGIAFAMGWIVCANWPIIVSRFQ